MSAIVIHEDGLDFHADSTGDEPRCLDLQIAERLGFSRPRDVRKLIDRLRSSGIVKESELRATVAQTSGRPATEYWLSETAALKVAARSDTDAAIAQLDTMVRVFVAVKRRLREPPPAPALPSTTGINALLAACRTVGESPLLQRELYQRLGYAAFMQTTTWAKAEGALRRHLGIVSYRRLPMNMLDEARRVIDAMVEKRWPILRAPKLRLLQGGGGSDRQGKLF